MRLIALVSVVATIAVGYTLLFVLGVGVLVSTENIRPSEHNLPWNYYLLQSRNNTPTKRCKYLIGFETVERYQDLELPNGEGVSICPRFRSLLAPN